MLTLASPKRIEKTLVLFSTGKYSCSQAVLCAYCEDLGLDEATAMAISSPFSGGMKQGKTCGAISGAFMVIGLYSKFLATLESRQKALAAMGVSAYVLSMENRHIPQNCADLLGFNPSIPQEAANHGSLKKEICPPAVAIFVEILEEVLTYMKQTSTDSDFLMSTLP